MKKILYTGIVSLCLAFTTTSCSDFLDTRPYDKIIGDDTWTSETLLSLMSIPFIPLYCKKFMAGCLRPSLFMSFRKFYQECHDGNLE